jgi:hypothetical protein
MDTDTPYMVTDIDTHMDTVIYEIKIVGVTVLYSDIGIG